VQVIRDLPFGPVELLGEVPVNASCTAPLRAECCDRQLRAVVVVRRRRAVYGRAVGSPSSLAKYVALREELSQELDYAADS
jgi:hypothetical protein